MNYKTCLMFWCSRMIRYRFSLLFAHYRNHWQIVSHEQLATVSLRTASLRDISENCCSIMACGTTIWLCYIGNGLHLLTFKIILVFHSLVSFAGFGKRVCVVPAPPVDRSDLWLQAAGTWGRQSSQRFLLSDIWRCSQPELHQRPYAQRGEGIHNAQYSHLYWLYIHIYIFSLHFEAYRNCI